MLSFNQSQNQILRKCIFGRRICNTLVSCKSLWANESGRSHRVVRATEAFCQRSPQSSSPPESTLMKYLLTFSCFLALHLLPAADEWRESFEESTGGWQAGTDSTVRTLSVEEGAPDEAVTEGKRCLELASENGGAWCQLAVQKDMAIEIKNANTLSFDLYVPPESLPSSTEGWAKFQIRLFGGKGDKASFDLTHGVELDLKKAKGPLYQVTWNYGDELGYTPDVNWIQVAFVKVASGGTMSPLYIDNLRLEERVSTATEIKTDEFLLNDVWELVWEDDFKGPKGAPPEEHWRAGAIWKKDGTWRDATLSRDEAYLDGKGNLVMRTRYEDGKRLAPYLVTSEAGTYSKAESLTFGPGEDGIFIEWRANVSQFKAHAAWFALWLFSDTPYTKDSAQGSEIDLMEYVPFQNNVYSLMNKFNAAVHLADDGSASVSPPVSHGHTEFNEKQWHTWGLLWTKDKQVFYLDGKPYWVNTKYVSSNDTHGLRMSIEIANGDPAKGNKNNWGHAVGKFEDNPTDRLPSYAYVDYVRVYQNVPKTKDTVK